MSSTETFDGDFTKSIVKEAQDVVRAINLIDDERSQVDMIDGLNVRATSSGFVGRRALLSSDIMVRYDQTINYRTNGFNTKAVRKHTEPTDCRGVFVGFESWKLGNKKALMYRLEMPMDENGVFSSVFAPVEGSKLSLYKNDDEMRELAYTSNLQALEKAMNYLADFDDSDDYQEALSNFAEFYVEVIEGEPDAVEIAGLGVGLEQLWAQASVADDTEAMSLTMELVLNLVRGDRKYAIRGHELLTEVTKDGIPKVVKAYNTSKAHAYTINGFGTMDDYGVDSAEQPLIPVFTAVNDKGETCMLPLKYVLEFEDLGQG